jgi:hypothetical protein
MKFCTLSIIPLLLFGTTHAHGAVIMVSPGQSIQAAVDSASSGDTIRISEGVYSQNVSISAKSINLIVQPGESVQVNNITATNPNAVARVIYLKNLRIQGDVNGTSNDFNIHSCNITGDVNVDQGSLTIIKSTVGANISINHPNRISVPTQAQILQTTIPEKLTCKADTSIIGYNSIRFAHIEGNSQIVGNHFNGDGLAGIGIDVNGSSSKVKIQNNQIHGYFQHSASGLSNVCIGIRVDGQAKADILNNLIFDCYDLHGGGINQVGMGIFVSSTSGTSIIGNALWGCFKWNSNQSPNNRLVWAPFSNVIFKKNLLWKQKERQVTNHFGGGVQSIDNIIENNMTAVIFNDLAGGDFTPHPASALINAGSPLPQYNDRDGSRNDIGMFGGHNFIPDGRTTNKPIVLGLDIAPIAVPTGGTVTIESTGASVK